MENGSHKRALPPGLYALCDDGLCPQLPLLEKARRLLQGGVGVMQLRLKLTPDRAALSFMREAVELCRRSGAVCLVNDRVDLALLSGAHGVHLGEEDLPPAQARRLLGASALIGVTARGGEGIRQAARAGADYVGVGPVFPSATKQVSVPPLGLSGLEALVRQSPLPVVAISGIGLSNIGAVAATGAHGAAVASDLLRAPDLAERARQLQRAFGRR